MAKATRMPYIVAQCTNEMNNKSQLIQKCGQIRNPFEQIKRMIFTEMDKLREKKMICVLSIPKLDLRFSK